jgi:hypothetical protein
MPQKLSQAKQQGKAYTPRQREEIFQSLKPYFTLGYDVKNACILAQVPYTTITTWLEKDNSLRIQVQSWQNMVNAKARQNVVKAINEGDQAESKWWLERKERNDFSTKSEQDITSNGRELGIIILPNRNELGTATETD